MSLRALASSPYIPMMLQPTQLRHPLLLLQYQAVAQEVQEVVVILLLPQVVQEV